MVGCGLNSSGSLAISSEYGNEPFDSIKGGEFD
jgi:hypothetical protein